MVGISVQTIFCLLVTITIGFIFDWRLALINIACMPLMIISSVLEFKLQQGFSNVDEVIETSAGGIVSESVCNTKTIYCYNMQRKVVRMYSRILKNGMKTINKSSVTNGIAYGFSQFCLFITHAIIFYAGGAFLYEGTLTVKNMLRAIFVFLFAAFGLGQAQQFVGDMSSAKSAIVNIFNVLDQKSLIDPIEDEHKHPREKKTCQNISCENLKGKIEFRNVKFANTTRPDVTVFEDLSFIIKPGQSAAFVGYSGSGKSTIIQLIERFYDPIKG
jgi:ATP-binding cassette subfamily B (MDR/TAP) protein 1